MPERFLRRTLDDEEIVVDLEKGEFYGLNRTAARILELWRDGVREPAAIAEALAAEFEIDVVEAQAAAKRLLDEATDHGLLEDEGA